MKANHAANVGLTAAVIALGALTHHRVLAADSVTTVAVDIAPQPLEGALVELCKQGHVQLLIPTASLPRKIAGPLRGRLALSAALEVLLKDTGLTYRLVGNQTVAIIRASDDSLNPAPVKNSNEVPNTGVTAEPEAAPRSDVSNELKKEGRDMRKGGLIARLAALLGACASMASPGTACAQATDVNSRAVAPDNGALDEITVTAQRRAEPLQSVPISVTAITQTALKDTGAVHVGSLNVAVPGMTISYAPSGTFATYIRGVGSQSANVGDEPSVAMYVDGFYVPTATMAVFSFSNIDHVEVLKGPQGTLFGRNASGGVMQVVTTDPSSTASLNASVGYGNFHTATESIYGTGSFSSVAAFDISAQSITQGEGWGRDLTTGADANRTDEKNVRARMLLQPTEDLKCIIAVDFGKFDSDQGVARSSIPGGQIALNVPVQGDIYDTQQNGDVAIESRQWGLQSTTHYNAGPLVIANLAQIRRYSQELDTDADYGPLNLVEIAWRRLDQLVTEEFQVTSTKESAFKWIAGVFWMNYNSEYQSFYQSGAAVRGVIGVFPNNRTESAAPFAQATVSLSSDTRLTLGARYTQERKDFRFGQNLNYAPVAFTSASLKQSKPTWRVALDHDLAKDVMIYASYNRGFKSGGFNVSVPPQGHPPVKPEVVDAYEAGIKSEFLNHRLRLNLAAYYNRFKDLQLQTLDTGPAGLVVANLTNATSARIKGVEFSVQARPIHSLGVDLGANYLDAKYGDFDNAPFSIRNANGTDTTLIGNASGLPLVRSPPITLNAGLNHTLPLGTYNLISAITYYHSGGFVFEPDQRLRQGAYDLTNFSLRLQSRDERWQLRMYADNVFNQPYYIGLASSAIGDSGSPGAPRLYGISLDVKL